MTTKRVKGRWLSSLLLGVAAPTVCRAQSVEELRDMPIAALANLDVTSVTKSSGSLSDAPASIFVITHDDIMRSGNITLPGILRIAPNLQVMRGSPNDVVVASRGLSGSEGAQNFANKLLVLIDGRSVYTPLYSGVYWDMQDVLPEDVDRIEVQNGPGATLWGANAVNGVINVVTRNAGASQGLYGTGAVGNRTYDLGLRYGGTNGKGLNYRVFAKRHENFETNGAADDGSRRTQVGFRVDLDPGANDLFMLQGDAYFGRRGQGGSSEEMTEGYDVLGRWDRSMGAGGRLQVKAYYDHAARRVTNGGGKFWVDTFDLDVQHNFSLGGHDIVWGGGVRFNKYEVRGIPNLEFSPGGATLFLANLFVQDSVAISPTMTAVAGLKVEHGPYRRTELLPSVRLSWKPNEAVLAWGAVSRAVRSPTPFDRDVLEYGGGSLLLHGNAQFRSEKLVAFELGTRLTPAPDVSIAISGYLTAMTI